MSSGSSSSSGGIGFAGLLTVALIVLKLTNVIAWSWVWVLAPIWMSAALVVTILLVILVVGIIVSMCEPRRYR
jgi:membrane protein YdbS with pleckstrin-like domain